MSSSILDYLRIRHEWQTTDAAAELPTALSNDPRAKTIYDTLRGDYRSPRIALFAHVDVYSHGVGYAWGDQILALSTRQKLAIIFVYIHMQVDKHH